MSSPLISIVLLNYNRPELGSWVLKLLDKQRAKNFEVILIDNASDRPIPEEVIGSVSYPINVLKFSKKLHNQQLNAALQVTSGEIIMPFLADDDFLLPSTTQVIERVFGDNPDADVVNLGTVIFDLQKFSFQMQYENGKFCSRKVFLYPARDVAFGYISNWAIGQRKPQPLPVCGHPSATVLSRRVLQKTLKAQGDLIMGPFGDVGLLGPLFQTKHLYKVDLPLTFVGMNHPQDSGVMKEFYGESKIKASRFKWEHLSSLLKYSPLKGVTHFNLGGESHLQVLKANGFEVNIPNDLSVDFYINHLSAIVKDVPWTQQSDHDFEEGMEHLLNAMKRNFVSNHAQIINHFNTLRHNQKNNAELRVEEDSAGQQNTIYENSKFERLSALFHQLDEEVHHNLKGGIEVNAP
jgi:hypothetical protein